LKNADKKKKHIRKLSGVSRNSNNSMRGGGKSLPPLVKDKESQNARSMENGDLHREKYCTVEPSSIGATSNGHIDIIKENHADEYSDGPNQSTHSLKEKKIKKNAGSRKQLRVSGRVSPSSFENLHLRAPNLQTITEQAKPSMTEQSHRTIPTVAKKGYQLTRASLSTNLTTLGGGKRRIHQEGLLMLGNHYNLKESELKSQIMENRIKRLEFEETRAQKNQAAAERKAEMMLAARNRHHEDLMRKFQHWEQQSNDLKQLKMHNYIETTRRKANTL
jgi:hypothetical protein